jgi:hypothetical protein
MIALGSVLAIVILLCGAGFAEAATPAWKLLAATGPTYLPPEQSEIQRITVEAEGGTIGFPKEGEGELAPVVGSGTLATIEGNAVATIGSVATGSAFEVGARITYPGEYEPLETTIVSCSADCRTPGSTVTLSRPAAATEAAAEFEVFTKQASVVSGEFRDGDEVAGKLFEYFAPGATVTAVEGGIVTLSNPTTFEYLSSEGAIAVTTKGLTSVPYNASSEEVQTALEGVLGAGTVSVTGGPGGTAEHPYFVDFTGPLADQNVAEVEVDGTGLTGAHASFHVFTIVPGGPGTGIITINPANMGGEETAGEYVVEVGPLPEGILIQEEAHGLNWSCSGPVGSQRTRCTSETSVASLSAGHNILIPIEVRSAVAFTAGVPVTISGGGGGAETIQLPVTVSSQQAKNGIAALWAGSFDSDGNYEVQAGGHPYSAATFFLLNTVRAPNGKIVTVGDPRELTADLPPGFSGDPLATPRCPQAQPSQGNLCEPAKQGVGKFTGILEQFGNIGPTVAVSNVVPPNGYPAEFTVTIATVLQSLLASVRSSEDYGVRITAPNVPNYLQIYGAFTALEGFPAGGEGRSFLSNATSCAENAREAPVAGIRTATWQNPDVFSLTATQVLPPVTNCAALRFHPSFSFQPSVTNGSSGTGAAVDLHIPQEGLTDASKLATPNLKKAVVHLPEGLSLNASSANGLESCSESQIGFLGDNFPLPNPMRFSEAHPTCPDGSKLGTAEVDSPLVEGPLKGTIYLAAQEENPFHSLLAIYVVIDDAKTGIMAKLPGELQADSASGQLAATFDYNPQLAFEDLKLAFRGGGPRSELATPEICGQYKTTGSLEPWSAPESGPPALIEEGGFNVSSNCASSASARPFAPGFSAGTTAAQAGSYAPLVIRVSRKDGEQEITSLSFTLPKGLTGKLAGIPYCGDAEIQTAEHKSGRQEQSNPSCPSASQIGTVDTAAGVGSEPVHVGGKLYLAGPYKGAPVSSVVITPALAGPFDLGNVVVRAPLYLNHETAELTAKSDSIPTILKGIPLKLRAVDINVDRPGFIINPTDCTPMTASASFGGGSGASANASARFQVGGCEHLKFAPKLTISLKGGTRRNGNPALTATLNQPAGQANISKVSVALPHSEFLEQGHIRTNCTRVQFAAEQCPPGSIYGHAEAITPLLDQPLKGPVYLRSSSHRLPDLVAALKGPASQPIEIDLDGRIDSFKGGIRTSFETVPDAPVSKFVLRMQGGKKSLLVNSTNICKGKHKATVEMTGQNALQHNFLTPLKVQCRKGHGGKKKQRGGKKQKS